jgi:hypothetical protein
MEMNQRIVLGFLILSLLLFPLCAENKQPQETTTTTVAVEATAVTTSSGIPLNELQQEACINADLGGTCKSKLEDLNVVPLIDCCKYLGKCCE